MSLKAMLILRLLKKQIHINKIIRQKLSIPPIYAILFRPFDLLAPKKLSSTMQWLACSTLSVVHRRFEPGSGQPT